MNIYMCVYICTYMYIYVYTYTTMCHYRNGLITAGGLIENILLVGLLFLYHSRRRSDLKYLDLQIGQFSCALFWVTGTPVYSLENWFEILGTPVKTCLKVTGTPVKTCLKFWRNCNYEVRSFPPVDSTWVCVSLSWYQVYILVLECQN